MHVNTMIDGHNRKGFTIVELLIVIVVIGILAAIATVAYTGVQTRARDASVVQVASSYFKALSSYGSINGSYPNYASACLGEGSGTCWPPNQQSEVAGFNTALKTTVSPLPRVSSGGQTPLYLGTSWGWTLDGQPAAFILYIVQGASKCEFGPIINPAGSPNFLTSNAPGNYSVNGTYKECWVPLPRL